MSDREQIERDLRRERDYAAALVNAMEDGLCLLSPEGVVLEVSPSLCRMTGFTREELIGASAPYPYWPDVEPEALERGFGRIREHGSGEWDLEFRRPDGVRFPVILHASAMLDETGAVIGYLSTIKDVTERKRDEEHLRRREAEQAALRRVATSVATQSDPSATFALVAAEVASLLGVDAGMVARFDESAAVPVGWWGARRRELRITFPLTGDGALARVHRTGSPARVGSYERLGEDPVANVARASEYRSGVAAPIRVGGVLWGAILAATTRSEALPGDAEARLARFAELVGVAIASADARTALAQASRRTELILDAAGEAICGVDLSGQATFANAAATRITGYSSEELLGRSLHDLIHHTTPEGEPFPWEQCPIQATLREGVARQNAPDTFFRIDGESFPVEVTSTPIEEGGRVVGAVMVFRDVSERRAVERLKDEFTSVVSHELRTPLTSIRGSLGLLAAGVLGPLSDKAQHMVDIAVANTDRLVRLINDILDIERMESGTALIEKRTCDAADLARQAVAVMQGLADEAGVTLAATTAPAPLWADPDRILQTLTNLLSNAIKFSPSGGTIGLDVERRGDEVLISVQDEGRGIPPDKIESVFGRFQQVDASDARQKGGTGLGLAICRGIVEQHGGRIWADSIHGEGSTFRISLPALAEPPRFTAVDSGAVPVVLVCDDDLGMLETVAEILEQRGFGVIGVTTGEEALVQAASQSPVAILLDLLMPGMNGWETAAALKERPETRDIPIIIMSGLAPLAGEMGEADAVDWLTKPLDADVLFRGLDRARQASAGRRVLVVEDDADLARVLIATLASHDLEAHHAASAREAIAMSESLVPDLVLLDLGLPDLDGLALVDWLRQHGYLSRVPIAVYTGRGLSEDERASLRAGGTEVLVKSLVAPERLVERVLELVGRVAEPQKGLDAA